MLSISSTKKVHVASALLCGLLLFTIHAYYRENLIPYRATSERARWLLTGDEPSYLLLAQAIASGDGLNIRPAHEKGTYKNFQPRCIVGSDQYTWQHYRSVGVKSLFSRSNLWGNAQILPHSPLLPFLISPFSKASSKVRWTAASLQAALAAIASVGILLLFSCKQRSAFLFSGCAAVIFGLGSMPIAYYTAQIYPELIASVMLLLAIVLWMRQETGFRLLGAFLMVAKPLGNSQSSGWRIGGGLNDAFPEHPAQKVG